MTEFRATPKTWMFDEAGNIKRGDEFTKAMNDHYAAKYAGLSTPILGLEVFNLKEPEWALKNLIQEEGMTMIHGSPGAGKSLMAMDWAYTLAHPQLQHWFDQPKKRNYKPMYIFTEGISGLRTRSQAWQKEKGVTIPSDDHGVLWIRDAVRLNRTDDPENPWTPQVAALKEMFEDFDRDILFVDTLANTFGGNENSQQDANNYLAALRMFVNEGVPVVLVHHNKKDDKEFRGSTVFEGAVDTKVALENSGGHIRLYITKQKDGDPGFHLQFRLKVYEWEGDGGYELSSVVLEHMKSEARVTSKQAEILTHMELLEKNTTEAIAIARGGTLESTANMLRRMEETGLIAQGEDLLWYRTNMQEDE